MSSNTTNLIEPKYRPAFSSAEIQYLINICNKDKRPETAEVAFAIASRLKIFALKAQLGIVIPAFSSNPKQTLDEKLGLEELTPVQKRELAYKKWQGNPLMCSSKEIEMAHLYRYENGMMTDIEEKEYESR